MHSGVHGTVRTPHGDECWGRFLKGVSYRIVYSVPVVDGQHHTRTAVAVAVAKSCGEKSQDMNVCAAHVVHMSS